MRVVMLVFVAGCYDPQPPTGAPCGPGGSCPAPLVCDPATDRCERDISAPADAPPVDARAPDAAPSDCWAAWRSGAPVLSSPQPLDALNTSDTDIDPTFFAENGILYIRRDFGGLDVFRAQRASKTEPFAVVDRIAALSSTAEDLRVSQDDTRTIAVFSSARNDATTGGLNFWMSTRAAVGEPWGMPTTAPFAAVNNDRNQYDPELTADALAIYFSEVPPNSPQQLFVTRRATAADAFATPQLVAFTAEPLLAADPTVSPDELVLVYASGPSPGVTDLQLATRSSTSEPFTTRTVLSVSSASGADGDADLSADGCELVFSSTRSGNRDLWIAQVQP